MFCPEVVSVHLCPAVPCPPATWLRLCWCVGGAGYDCFVVVEGEAEVYDIDHDGTEELVATRPVGSKISFLYTMMLMVDAMLDLCG